MTRETTRLPDSSNRFWLNRRLFDIWQNWDVHPHWRSWCSTCLLRPSLESLSNWPAHTTWKAINCIPSNGTCVKQQKTLCLMVMIVVEKVLKVTWSSSHLVHALTRTDRYKKDAEVTATTPDKMIHSRASFWQRVYFCCLFLYPCCCLHNHFVGNVMSWCLFAGKPKVLSICSKRYVNMQGKHH